MVHKIIVLIYFSFSIGILSAQTQIGNASFYADKFDGRRTASGAIFKQNKLTAAHRTLDFGTKVRVTNLDNNKTVDVIINDRGPFVNSRVIDLSKSAALKLDFVRRGVAKVKVEILDITKKEKPTKNTPPISKPTPSPVPTNNQNVITTKKVDNNTSNVSYYEVSTKKANPNGFGVQVASHKEAINLIKRCEEIKNKTNKNVLVQIGEAYGEKVYRIIIGSFPTREKANDFNERIKNQFTGSFVVTF